MNLSKNNCSVILASKKGYIVTDIGDVISPYGNMLSLMAGGERRHHKQYYKFNIKSDGKHYTVLVHKLVAYQKFGDRLFESGIVVRHINDVSLDNRYDNIAIGTHRDNRMDMASDARMEYAICASTHIRKFSDIVVLEIRADRLGGMTYSSLMNKYDISSKGTLHHILNNVYVTVV